MEAVLGGVVGWGGGVGGALVEKGEAEVEGMVGWGWKRKKKKNSPNGWRLWPFHLQVVVLFLCLEVCKNDGNGVSGISKNGPRTVRIIVIFTREIGTWYDATWTPQSITTCVLSCQSNMEKLLLGIGILLHKRIQQEMTAEPFCSKDGRTVILCLFACLSIHFLYMYTAMNTYLV